MTKSNFKGLVTLGSLLATIGFLFLFFSVHFGLSLAENWLVRQGGADSSKYLFVIEGYTNSFLAAGSILLGGGLAAIICACYKIFTINEE